MRTDSQPGRSGLTALTSLRRFMQSPTARERCELCAAALAADHTHLLELSTRRLACACDPCGVLFSGEGAGKYRRVPRRVRLLSDFRLTDVDWEGLQLPIDLAFFVHNTAADRIVALYPSPGGATEALVPADAWQMLVEDNPVLRDFEPDVEALLVNRLGQERACFRVGVDHCYKLVGLVRTHWRGLSGGAVVWQEIKEFFEGLKERSDHA
jgi:hypothetical protein